GLSRLWCDTKVGVVAPIFSSTTLRLGAGALVLGLSVETAALAQDRMPPIAPEKYDEAQKKAAAEFRAARNEPVFGPFSVLIRSAELMTAYRIFGDYLRFQAALGSKLTEVILLLTARDSRPAF